MRTLKTEKIFSAHNDQGSLKLSLTVPVQHLLVDMDDVVFDCRTYMYNYRYSSEIWNTLKPITTVLAYLTPNIIIIIATILLLTSARKQEEWPKECRKVYAGKAPWLLSSLQQSSPYSFPLLSCHTLYDPPRTSARLPLYRQDYSETAVGVTT